MLRARSTLALATLSLLVLAALAPTAACGGDSDKGGANGGAAGSTVSTNGNGGTGTGNDGGGGATSTSGAGARAASSSGGSGGAGGSASTTGSGGGAARTYHTNFPLTENPISEHGMWINGAAVGLDWHDCSTTPGLAIGHQQDTSFTDGTALLTGAWGPTQTVTAKVHSKDPQDSCYQEVEMRLRSSLSAHSCSGYEISFKATETSGAYLIIVRWNGPVGSFTYLLNDMGSQYGVTEGDEVKATVVGDLITAYKNGVEMGHATDDTYANGAPGMGFNLETSDASCRGTNGHYGYTDFTAHAE